MLSVIVPVFNCEKYIERCLKSIVDQTLEEFEIIVIDDGSTDNSITIIDRIASGDSRIKVIHKKNEGLLSARLDGVKSAEGDVIGFVDSDDYIELSMFKDLYQIMEDTRIDMVSSGIIREYVDGRIIEVRDRFNPGLYDDLVRDIYPKMLWDFKSDDFGLYCNLVNKLFRKEMLLDVLENIPSDITYGEDAAVFYNYMMQCKKIYISHALYYHYCLRDDSMCSTKDEQLNTNAYNLYTWLRSSFELSVCKNILLQQLKKYILMVERHRISMLYDIHGALFNYWKFKYPDDILDNQFILYGAGGCGQAFYRYIRKKGMHKNVVAWVDNNYSKAQEQCDYPLRAMGSDLSEMNIPIILALKSNEIKSLIKKELMDVYDIPSSRIIALDADEISFL